MNERHHAIALLRETCLFLLLPFNSNKRNYPEYRGSSNMCKAEEAFKEILCVVSQRETDFFIYLYLYKHFIINISSTIEQMRSRTKQRRMPQVLVFFLYYINLF